MTAATSVRTAGRVRAVVLGVLLLNVVWGTTLAVSLVASVGALLVAVLAVQAALHTTALWAAVSPWLGRGTRDAIAAGLLVATAVAWAVLTPAAEAGEEPFAWLVGCTLGALVVLRPWAALVAAAGGAALLVAAPGPGSVRDGLVFAGLAALLAGGLALLVVWMLGALRRAEEGRDLRARLAVAEERLRLSHELHDVLGHRLSTIALRAELAGDTTTQDLASRTLQEVRAAVHGFGTVDLAEQLRGAELVLGSAGVAVQVDAEPVGVSTAASQLLAAAVREAVTNVLRHSAATRCRIALETDDGLVRLTVRNDGVAGGGTAGTGAGGIGLGGLAERAAMLGARLRAGAEGDGFALVVEVPT